MMKNVKLSIIIVNYKVENELFNCLLSISKKIKRSSFEVIVVENDTSTNLATKLKKFNFVKYIKSKRNLGFGGANNLGVKFSKGEYLFFLNPDTVIESGEINFLLQRLNDKKIGIVAPLLVHPNGELFEQQGSRALNPIRAIFSLSAINKFFPMNPISTRYWMKDIKREREYEVDVVPGTAFIIKRELFEKLGGFDDKFFLYFEEMDICRRAKNLGYKVIMSPHLRVIHLWGVSTRKSNVSKQIFLNSQYYYFKKYYGFPVAILVTSLIGINLKILILGLIIGVGMFLRLDRLDLSIFIPDQGFFYISARDILLQGQIPLVGITSSHTWLHQGALWTYLLAPFLLMFNFSPLSGVYLAALFGLASIILVYMIGKRFVSLNYALIASALYSGSPLVVIHERIAYHTAPISFFVLLFIYSMTRWIKGDTKFFPIILLSISILYNLELATVVFWPILILYLFIGYRAKDKWFTKLNNKKILIASTICLIIPMVPILVYDVQNGFPQTIKYAAWIVYSPINSLINGKSPSDLNFLWFNALHLQRLVLFGSEILSVLIFIVSIIYLGAISVVNIKSFKGVIFLTALIPLIGYIVSGTPSEAYLPMLFSGILFSVAFTLYAINTKVKYFGVLLLIIIVISNIVLLYNNNYLVEQKYGYGWSLSKKENIINQIYVAANGEKYNLSFRNDGHKIVTSAQNYEYLLWWRTDNPPVNYSVKRKIQVVEGENDIKVVVLQK